MAGAAPDSGIDAPGVVLIQESHWTEAIAPNFKTDSWTVLTSPAVDCKAAGLVMLLDKQVCSSGTLTYADPLPGRGAAREAGNVQMDG